MLPTFAAPTPQGAVNLLTRAGHLWAEAALQVDPAERFRQAHLAALRGAAAVVAVDPKPVGRPRGRPTSAWILLAAAAPQLASWSAYFSDSAVRRAAIEAGASCSVTEELADELVSAAGSFITEVAQYLQGRSSYADAVGAYPARAGRDIGAAGPPVRRLPVAS